MTKTLRKYNRWLLAIFGSLLLVTWLVSGTSQQFRPDPGKRVVATLAVGDKIRAGDVNHADQEYKLLSEMLGALVKTPQPYGMGIENGTHWYLLSLEADRAGLVGEAGDGADWVPQLARMETEIAVMGNPQMRAIAQQYPQLLESQTKQVQTLLEKREQVGANAYLRPHQVDMALAKLRGVYRLITSYEHAARLSDIAFTREARNLLTEVSLDAVVIPADAVLASIPEPAPEKLTELFDKYKAVAPGSGELGFGYLLPKRIKLEWMTLARQPIADAVKLDPIDVQKYYQQNRTEFKGEFAAEKSAVEQKLRAARVTEVFASADRIYKSKIKSATRKLVTEGATKILPPDWETQRPRMESLAQEIVTAVENDTKIKIPLPAVTIKASEYTPIDQRSLGALGSIGYMQFNIGGKNGTFAQLMGTIHELDPSTPSGLQVGVPFEHFVGINDGDRAYFTILDAKTESAPLSLDEVKNDVIRDAKRLAAFEKLKADAPTYQLLAVTDGLEAVSKSASIPPAAGAPAGATPTNPPVLKRVVVQKLSGDRRYPQLDDQGLRDAVMGVIHTLGQDTKPAPDNLSIRTVTYPVAKSQSLAVMQITGQKPVSLELMRQLGDREAGAVMQRELLDAAADLKNSPFTYAAVKQRLGYKAKTTEGADKKDDEAEKEPA